MELSEYVEGLRAELTSLTRVAGNDVARAAELVARALEPSVRLTLLDVLSAAAAEITSRLGDAVVEVRLAGGEPSFVIQHAPTSPAGEPAAPAGGGEPDDAGVARVTLRLGESLKSRVERAAGAEGISVNSWFVHAAQRALDGPAGGGGFTVRRGPGQRITGFARS